MAFNKPGPSASMSTTEEYTVRVPKDKKKRYKMMKFSTGNDLDFVKLSQTPVKMERENNLKEFKTANDIDMMPKFGAGSEFGREQKEEARRKKYGIMVKKYNPEDQPWLLKIGSGKQVKKYKGVREGTITDNASYYIFTQCADGAFEAHPVEEWHSFTPMPRYKYLNSDEAEEEYNRRDKTMNMFGIMLRKRIRNEDTKDVDPDEGEQKKKSKVKGKKSKDFMLTDMEEWAISDEDDEEEEEDEREGADGDEKPKKAKVKKGDQDEKKKVRNAKHNSDDEAVEESDEGDFDDREMDYVDYMTDSSSGVSDLEVEDKDDKYEDKGVDMEDGLRKLIDSEGSSEEEEEKKETNGAEKDAENGEKKGDESDSSSSSSGSDSDIEKEGISSALFLLKKAKEEKIRGSPIDKAATPRSGTPNSVDGDDKKGIKRKLEGDTGNEKKMRTESPVSPSGGSSEGITEDQIRRYLMRKPMTAKEVALKFKSKKLNMNREEMTRTIAQMLKKINPDRKLVNKKLYLSLKKPE